MDCGLDIVDNRIKRMSLDGISLQAYTKGAVVQRNYFHDIGGICIEEESNAVKNIITDNVFDNVGATTTCISSKTIGDTTTFPDAEYPAANSMSIFRNNVTIGSHGTLYELPGLNSAGSQRMSPNLIIGEGGPVTAPQATLGMASFQNAGNQCRIFALGGSGQIKGWLLGDEAEPSQAGIQQTGSGHAQLRAANSSIAEASATGSFRPVTDNAVPLGGASNRWTEVFAVASAINTSDAREKEWRGPLDDAEMRVAKKLAKLVGVYRWHEAVAKKGDDARLHVGVTAQDVEAAFASEGLDGFRYGVLCWDEWDAAEAEYDEDGNLLTPAKEAGEGYGVRYEELWAWVAAGFEARLSALARLIHERDCAVTAQRSGAAG